MAAVTIDRLLNLVPDKPQEVLQHLQSHPQLAHALDSHGYTLLHAAVSYNQPELLRQLVQTYNADINIRDEDQETPLFAAESEDIARLVVEELGADVHARNIEGQTCAEKLEAEGDQPFVAAYLRQIAGGGSAEASVLAQTAGAADAPSAQAGTVEGSGLNGIARPPPLPQGVEINLGTMAEDDVGEAPDPEFRRRIEELAARPDFQTEQGQRELRQIVEDALRGVSSDEAGREATRRRVD